MSNAPTTKVQNTVAEYQPLYVEFAGRGTWAKADIRPAQVTEFDYIPEQFVVTFHQGAMPAYDEYTFDTIQELANFMREQADLRTWKILDTL